MTPRRSSLPALLAALTALAIFAPSALASGTLTVGKTPGAGAGTVTGTIPVRGFDGEEEIGETTTIVDCGSDCSEVVHQYEKCMDKNWETVCTFHDESVTLTQTPAAGWQFTGWTGCTSQPANGSCKRTMDQNRSITASYVDVGAPSVAFTGPVENAKLHGVVNVGAVAGDNAAVSRVRFYVNNVEIADDTNGGDGWGTSFNTNAYPHAQVISVKAVAFDTSGNASVFGDDDDRAYRIDSQTGLHFAAPTPADGEWIGATDPAVSVAFAKNDDTPADSVSFQCALGGGALSACASPLGSGGFAADGTYAVTVKATDDAAPTANTAQISRTFHVDRTAPAVAVSRPAEGSAQPKGFTPDYTVGEANPAAAGAVTCKLDGAAYGACGELSGLAAGAHSYSVKAVDKAGNESVVTRTFTVDGTAPNVAITGGPKEDEIVTSSSVSFTFSADDPSAPLTRSCRIDGAFGPCTSGTTHSASGLSEGAHVFELRVADAAGNTTTVKRDFVVNAVRPAVAITDGPAEGAVIKATGASFKFAASGGDVQCSLDSTTAFGPCVTGGSHTVSGLGNGGHTFRVRVRDASNDEVVQSRTFTVDTSVAPPPARPVINALLSSDYKAFAKHTIYRRLVVTGAPAGAKVTVTCKGKKCPAKSFTKQGGADVKLAKFLKKKLRAGTKLTIRVTKDGSIGKQFVLQIRKAKRVKVTISQIA